MEKTLGARLEEIGITMHELVMAYERSFREAEPGDAFSGNPAKWPSVRGVTAVTTLLLDAMERKT
jgi:hypothetical protein